MIYCYLLLESTVSDENGNDRFAYGITVTNSDGEVLESYPDIFNNKEKAERFIFLCNKNSLSTCHLPDVIEDMFV